MLRCIVLSLIIVKNLIKKKKRCIVFFFNFIIRKCWLLIIERNVGLRRDIEIGFNKVGMYKG